MGGDLVGEGEKKRSKLEDNRPIILLAGRLSSSTGAHLYL